VIGRLDAFLKPAFVVGFISSVGGAAQPFTELMRYKCERGIESAVQINGGDHRFGGIGQNRVLFPAVGQRFPFSQQQVGAKVDFPGNGGQFVSLTSCARFLDSSPSVRSG
jgi:hypothetical protein